MGMRTLERHAKAVVKGVDQKALVSALGALVSKRLKPVPKAQPRVIGVDWAKPSPLSNVLNKPKRRSSKRRGKYQSYMPTGKLNYARHGTWRHHMIATIVAHTNTLDATIANEQCGVEAFAKQKLGFAWCEANGYITFN